MIAAIVSAAADALGEAIAYAGQHPEIAIGLVRTVKAALSDTNAAGGNDSIDRTQTEAYRSRLIGIASGLAAARANAVQEMARSAARFKLEANGRFDEGGNRLIMFGRQLGKTNMALDEMGALLKAARAGKLSPSRDSKPKRKAKP